jgi:hypothetical protein
VGAWSASAKATTIGPTISVDAANSDMLAIVEGLMIVTVSGSLQLSHASEVGGSINSKGRHIININQDCIMIRNGPISTKTFVRSDYNLQYRYVKAAIEGTGVTLTVTQNNSGDRLIRDIYGESNSNYATTDIHSKLTALYGVLGGSVLPHRFNWMDTRDLDAAYRLTFVGGWAHSSTGADPDGITGFADTHLNSANILTNYNTHLSYYSRENISSGCDIGAETPSDTSRFLLSVYYTGVGGISDSYDTATGRLIVSTYLDFRGLYLVNRSASNQQDFYRNGANVGASTTTISSVLPSSNIMIGGNIAGTYTNRECAFASVGSSLTSSENVNLYNAVQAYQTSLSRNV